MNVTTMQAKKRKVNNFEQMGSLEIMWKLIERHQMFILTTLFIIENIWLLVTQFN